MDLDVDLGEQTPSDDLPNETKNQMLSTFRDIRRPDVDDGTPNTLGRGDNDVIVFGNLESVEGFYLTGRLVDGWLVQDSLIDSVGYRVIDKLAENETVCCFCQSDCTA